MLRLLSALVAFAWATSASAQQIGPFAPGPSIPVYGGVGVSSSGGGPASVPLFRDSFTRPNTALGSLGIPPSGTAYNMYGPAVSGYPLPAATNGYVSSNLYVEDQNNGTYAHQLVSRTPRQIIWKVSWVVAGGSTGLASADILVSNASSGTIDPCLHIQLFRGAGIIQVLSGNAFTTLATMNPPTLAADGSIYTATLTINGNTVTMNLSGGSTNVNQTISATDPTIGANTGPHVYFENRMIDAIDAVRFHYVEID